MAPWNVRVKGEASCRSCGAEATDLHHIIPKSIGTRETKRDLRNGLPLCNTCHWRFHQGYKIRRECIKEDEWNYLVTVILTGRETLSYLEDKYPPASSITEHA